MKIREVASKRACPHVFPTFSAGDFVSIPIGSRCASGAHPLVEFGLKLETDVTGRAGHCLCLLGVGLKTNTIEGRNETVDCLLQEGGVPQCYVRVVHLKDRK